jgi:uncharacterized membrane protein
MVMPLNSLFEFSRQGTLEVSLGLGPLDILLVLAILATLFFFFYKIVSWVARVGQQGRTAAGPYPSIPNTPLEILQDRYARGEITGEQYRQLLEDLR